MLEVVFFGVFKPIVLWPEESFEHMKVIVLIDRFFKEVGTVDFSAGNGAPNQNFGIMQRLLYPIPGSLRQPQSVVLLVYCLREIKIFKKLYISV